MARSGSGTDTIRTRISLEGAAEVRRHLEAIGAAGERSGNQIRQTLLAATSGANSFTAGARAAGVSAGQMRFAVQSLGFQLNDIGTSLASGGSAMRVFAQQGGQIVQAFQQGGGVTAVLGAAATSIRSMITPLTAAAAGAAALAAGFALVVSRAISLQGSARQFDVILKGMSDRSGVTGKQLTEAAHRLRDVGLSFGEAQAAMELARRQGVKAADLEKIVRIGVDLNAVLGEGSLERFIAAAGRGGEPVEEFARQLGLIPKQADDFSRHVEAAAQAAAKSGEQIRDALVDRARAIADEQRRAADELAELTRKKGSAAEEIEFASAKRIQEINRTSNVAIADMLAQRSRDNAARLAEFNKQLEEAAQKAANGGAGMVARIGEHVKGLANEALGPAQRATRELAVTFQEMLNEFAQSQAIQTAITNLTDLLRVVTELVKQFRQLPGGGTSNGGTLDLTSATAQAAMSGNFASGGLIRGPGTSTSDSVLLRGSVGEFVTKARAVDHYGPNFFRALNSMAIPIDALRAALGGFRGFNMGGLVESLSTPLLPRSSRGFASGGLVGAGAGGGGRPVNLFLDGRSFGLSASHDVADQLIKHARGRRVRAAGRAPSWHAG